jgi:hypothetical protein
MPNGAVYVGRPTKWGNPWPIGRPGLDGEVMPTAEAAVERYEGAIDTDLRVPDSGTIRQELRGRDVVCWCGSDQPCHADVLMRIANDSTAAHTERSSHAYDCDIFEIATSMSSTESTSTSNPSRCVRRAEVATR